MLVHGFTGDITDWRFQVEEFAPTHRVLILDNRGHGRSSAPLAESAYSVEQMASDLDGLVRHVGFERFHLVGHSMGGAIAQEIALRLPERLLSLTLEDTSFCFSHHQPRMPDRLPPLPQARLEEVWARLGRMPQEVLRANWKALLTWPGSEGRAAQIRTPTLIIYGDDDAPAIVEGSIRLAELLPHSELHRLEGVAHSPQEECPQRYNVLLRAFVERHQA